MPQFLLAPIAVLPFPSIDPVIFSIGPLSVHWYGAGYVVGILFAWWYAKRLLSTPRLWAGKQPPFDPILIDDLVVWGALGVILGGRIGYILFYDFQRYIDNPFDILAIWQGGMSFHGGFLATMLAIILFARRRGVSLLSLFDVVAAGVPVALGLVRVTNFINSELWGRTTDVPWAFVFPTGGPEPRHPSQLYEAALEGLVLFVVLRLMTHVFLKLNRPGFVAGVFAVGYALSRIFVEFFRVPDEQLGYLAGEWLTMGMILSLPVLLIGLALIVTSKPAALPQSHP